MKIAVVGGDARMLSAAKLFKENGFQCVTAALGEGSVGIKDALYGASAAVLPLPCEKGGILNSPMSNEQINIEDIFTAGEGKILFIGGGLPQGEHFADYSLREDYLLRGAVPTAEAAVEIAMRESAITLYGSKVLIIGHGRIGARLVQILTGLGANVTVAARRSESRVLADMAGAKAVGIESLEYAAENADFIFNTVPFPLLNGQMMTHIRKSVPVIDLASGAGGADKDAAEKLGVKLIHALALPGKHSPETAGRIVYETVVEILRERGLLQ